MTQQIEKSETRLMAAPSGIGTKVTLDISTKLPRNRTTKIERLLQRSAKLQLFLMLRYSQDASLAKVHLESHLKWMISQEALGRIFLSGPIRSQENRGELVGATVLRASDINEARHVASQDPFVKSGFVTFELFEWTAIEGHINISIALSDSTASFA